MVGKQTSYSLWFLAPAGVVYLTFFLAPTFMSFFYSMTRWTLFDWDFTGLENYRMFFRENSLRIGFKNTLIYASLTAGLKVVFGFLLGAFLTQRLRTRGFLRSMIFFPTILSIIAVGVTFNRLMHPSKGVINFALGLLGIDGPNWLGDPHIALLSVISVDVWRGVGIATVIYIAGIQAIPQHYYEALEIDGGNAYHKLAYITLPLSRPATNSVIILAMIGGLRSFDLIWAMTRGGPGFTTDLIASIIYKQYQGGFYGLATAGNVLLFALVAAIAIPLFRIVSRREVDL